MSQPEIPFQSPVVPNMVDGSKVIQFQCRKGISCWNQCCSNIDISLTPYDILRLKRRLGISSTVFLDQYTVPYEMEKEGIAGVKFKPIEKGTACRFMQPEGCGVYEDRPTACRYYPVGLLSMRKQDEYVDRDAYALVEEDHCKGHQEPRQISIDDYRQEQGLPEYDELARGWRQLVLKKKSSGPSVGAPSVKSRQLFFMACYDIDTFRSFATSENFTKLFKITEEEKATFANTDLESEVALMQFAFRFLRQVLFGEMSITLEEEAAKERLEKVKAKRLQEEREAAEKLAQAEDNEAPFEDD